MVLVQIYHYLLFQSEGKCVIRITILVWSSGKVLQNEQVEERLFEACISIKVYEDAFCAKQ